MREDGSIHSSWNFRNRRSSAGRPLTALEEDETGELVKYSMAES